MRKGILGLSIAVLALLILVQLKGVESEFAQEKHEIVLSQIRLEKTIQVKNDVENAYRQVLEKTRGATIKERILNTAENLVRLEEFLEQEYKEQGIDVDLWFGAVTDSELIQLQQSMLDAKKSSKCSNCFDYSIETIDFEDKKIPLVTTIMHDENGKTIVSKKGGGFGKATGLDLSKYFSKIGLGCSLYEKEASANCFVGE